MFVIKAARLGHLVTFLVAHTMLFNNKTDVIDDVLLRNRSWQQIMIMSKEKPHLLGIIADRAWAVLFCQQRIMQLLKAVLRR